MRKLFVFIGVVAVLTVGMMVPTAVLAQTTASEEELVIDSIITENLYAAAEIVTINATSQADIVAAAGKIVINGDVNGNLILAAGEIEVNGNVTGDLLAAAGIVVVNGNITGDARIFSGQAFVNAESVTGDLVVAAGRAGIDTATVVLGKKMVSAGNAVLNSQGNPESLSEIAGTVSQADYFSHTFSSAGVFASALGIIISLLILVGGIVANYLIIRFFPTFTERTLETMRSEMFMSVVVGLGILVFSPIIGFILLISGIGVPVLSLLAALAVLAFLFSRAYGNYLVGRMILEQLKYENTGRLLPLVIGTLVFAIIGIVPVLGWVVNGLANILIPAWGIGAMSMHKWESVQAERTTSKPAKTKKKKTSSKSK